MCRALGLSVLFLTAISIGCSGDNGAPTKEASRPHGTGSVDDALGPVGEVVLWLRADGTIAESNESGESLSPDELREVLTEAARQFPAGPTITIMAQPAAVHGDLDRLLITCVDSGCEKFVLLAAGGGRSYPFELRRQAPMTGVPDPNQLPPMKLRMQADENGCINGLQLNARQFNDLATLQRSLISIIGDERGPRSIQESITLEMRCDASLKLQHVFESLEAVSGFTAGNGDRIALVEKFRPVTWGGGGIEEFAEEVIEEFEEEEIEEFEITEAEIETDVFASPETESIQEEVLAIEANDESSGSTVELAPAGEWSAPEDPSKTHTGSDTRSWLACRGPAVRKDLVLGGGGSAATEAAVAGAVKWFAAHQYPDGSWNFDHTRGPCQGRCPNPGDLREASAAATAMALLPFLGAGQTHTEGKYKDTVTRGLSYLVRRIKISDGTGSFEEPGGRMYSHGLCSIALCEAYVMTRDKALLEPAQLSLNRISYAQDPVGGGWRYMPKQPGDTSVFGWQLMALTTGHSGSLQVKSETVKGAIKFLDSVQDESGAHYGYTGPATGRHATTAIGLLSRMYLGWKKDYPAIKEGVDYLSEAGPSKANMYYNYYATQVMFQFGGDRWKKWNAELRDYLLNTQFKDGHASGSWSFGGGDHGFEKGGRHYSTSMATMMLEVYYRHKSIDEDPVDGGDFPF